MRTHPDPFACPFEHLKKPFSISGTLEQTLSGLCSMKEHVGVIDSPKMNEVSHAIEETAVTKSGFDFFIILNFDLQDRFFSLPIVQGWIITKNTL